MTPPWKFSMALCNVARSVSEVSISSRTVAVVVRGLSGNAETKLRVKSAVSVLEKSMVAGYQEFDYKAS